MAGAATGKEERLYNRIQDRVYFLLEGSTGRSKARQVIIYFLSIIIIANVIAVILETVNALWLAYEPWFLLFDLIAVTIFTIEYILRLWCCVKNPKYAHPIKGRIRYIFSPLALLDLISILPFYLPLIIPIEFRMLRMLRLLRVFRVLKLGRYSDAFDTFVKVIRAKKEELIIAFIMTLIILVLSSSALYFVEHQVQPDKFGSIPDAMWWAVITLATVGYGDVYPITAVGKLIAAIVALSAIGLFALPAGILAAGFAETLQKRRTHEHTKEIVCPLCGGEFNPDDAHHGVHKKPGHETEYREKKQD